jgi:hypothetical protein
MKRLKYLAIIVFFFGCKPKTEFYVNGKPCYAIKKCVKSHWDSKWEYFYGYNPITLKYEYHYGNRMVYVCDEYKFDTIEIK